MWPSKDMPDIFKWFLFMATDTVGEASFGESSTCCRLALRTSIHATCARSSLSSSCVANCPSCCRSSAGSAWVSRQGK
ncbi:hypothetical protein MRB53_041930 [Persea americana]|nr:hypothetical protein MRB53_041930 [Persea americana]